MKNPANPSLVQEIVQGQGGSSEIDGHDIPADPVVVQVHIAEAIAAPDCKAGLLLGRADVLQNQVRARRKGGQSRGQVGRAIDSLTIPQEFVGLGPRKDDLTRNSGSALRQAVTKLLARCRSRRPGGR